MLWVLIRSAENISTFGLTFFGLFYHFFFSLLIDHKSRMTEMDSFESHFFITCL